MHYMPILRSSGTLNLNSLFIYNNFRKLETMIMVGHLILPGETMMILMSTFGKLPAQLCFLNRFHGLC